MIVDYDVLEALVDLEAAMTSTTLIYEDAGSNVVFDTTALGMPDDTGDEFFADCEVVVTGPVRQPARRPVPARGAHAPRWRGSTAGCTSG